MDTSWIGLPNDHPAYVQGTFKFIELAKKGLVEGKTQCPCKKCKLKKWLSIGEIEHHILFKGFYEDYRKWIFHGEGDILQRMSSGEAIHKSSQGSVVDQPVMVDGDDMQGLLSAAFEVNLSSTNESLDEPPNEPNEEHEFLNQPDSPETPVFSEEEEARYNRLLEASSKELYTGCTTFSKLSFILHLFHLKSMNHWSAQSFTMLLKLLVDAFPQIMDFPTSYYEGKKIIKDLGLGYEKIHACPNNCMLYWGEFSENDSCHVCNTSRWKTMKGREDDTNQETRSVKEGEPAKVMRYFPLIPRLKRIYKCPITAEAMRWHDKDRVKDDGMLRHPADGAAWEEFDKRYPEFSADPRSVRLGLASDGFNPYRLMNTNYSTWPVVLIPYNLPPWLCMKPSSFILSIIIPGKSSPGINIDVYLQPLLHELNLLWEGVNAFDAYSENNFKLRGALMWTINDFPALHMLSGWSTKGYNACPKCTHSTHSYNFAGKICYTGHRKWLPVDHPYRSQSELFDGTEEYGHAPVPASGTEVMAQQEGIGYEYGKRKNPPRKKRKRKQVGIGEIDGDDYDEDAPLWNKKSKFFDLPYWQHNPLRHSLDVMHIEKNVGDNFIGTILDMDKSRDDVKARKAIEELKIKPHLWLKVRPNGDPYMPPASYYMSSEDKVRFLKVLQKLRVPDGYGSNLARCVNMTKRKLLNLKSHDNHVLMQDILPVALRASKATEIVDLLDDLSSFFKFICSTTINKMELDNVQEKLVLTLCRIEIEFLPTFFTIMVHLLVHLVEEVRLGGPVHYRWMYPIERYLAHLKSNVTNKAQPEGSIAEGYMLEETITFCKRYLNHFETSFSRSKRNDDDPLQLSNYLFNSGGRVIGAEKMVRLDDKSIEQAHRYVLLHSDEMKELRDEFICQKRRENRFRGIRANAEIESEWIINEFTQWLRNQVHKIDASNEQGKLRKALCSGLIHHAREFKTFEINGYKFVTLSRERYRKTQNSGVMVEADGEMYYGRLTNIYELNYYGSYRVVVFRCDWVDVNRGVKKYDNGAASVNFSKLMHTGRLLHDDPFIFSSQAKKVFYVEDEVQRGWLHAVKTKPRDLYDLGENDM